jgi:hypothetical protein
MNGFQTLWSLAWGDGQGSAGRQVSGYMGSRQSEVVGKAAWRSPRQEPRTSTKASQGMQPSWLPAPTGDGKGNPIRGSYRQGTDYLSQESGTFPYPT